MLRRLYVFCLVLSLAACPLNCTATCRAGDQGACHASGVAGGSRAPFVSPSAGCKCCRPGKQAAPTPQHDPAPHDPAPRDSAPRDDCGCENCVCNGALRGGHDDAQGVEPAAGAFLACAPGRAAPSSVNSRGSCQGLRPPLASGRALRLLEQSLLL